jgi:hypothetical protein
MIDAHRLTWAALLGRWIEFAQSAQALPEDEQGQRLKDSVPDIIMLQAVWFALGEVDQLPHDQRSLGLDRAELLIQKHGQALRERWAQEGLPQQLAELIDDAWSRLSQAQATSEPPSEPES